MAQVVERAGERWQGAPAADLIWCGWDDTFILFHRPSGKTHYLNSVSYQLIDQILREPKDLDSVFAEVFGDDTFPDAAKDEVLATLDRFEELGLVDRL